MNRLTPSEQAQRWAALSERTNARHIKRLKAWRSGTYDEDMSYVESVVDFCERFQCEYRDPGGSACTWCHKRLDKPTHTCQYRQHDHSLEEPVSAELYRQDKFSRFFDHVITVWWPANGAYGILCQPYISRYISDQTCADEEIAVINALGYQVTKIHPSPYGGMAKEAASKRLLVAFLITGAFAPPIELRDDPFEIPEHSDA